MEIATILLILEMQFAKIKLKIGIALQLNLIILIAFDVEVVNELIVLERVYPSLLFKILLETEIVMQTSTVISSTGMDKIAILAQMDK